MATLQAAWDLGIRNFDTANGYGEGEERLGQFLRDKARGEYTVASKAYPGKVLDKFIRQYGQSRERLGIEVLDTYFIHWPRPGIDPRPLMEFLEKERGAGRVRKIGVSNYEPHHLEAVREVGTVDLYQGGYHLFWRHAEASLVAYCADAGIPMQAYSPLGQGILTGKFPREPQFSEQDNRSRTVLFEESIWPDVYEATRELMALVESAGVSPVAVALQWIIRQKGFEQVVVGARSPEQIRASWDAMAETVPETVFAAATAISDRLQERIPEVSNFWRNEV